MTQKIAILRTITRICRAISSQLRHVSTIWKKLLKAISPHMSPQYGELRPTNGCDRFGSLGHPSKFQWVSRHGSVTAATSLYVHVLRSPILAALLHGSPAAGISQTLRRGTRNGITELPQRAPPIFGWAAITLSIGPHSSLFFFLFFLA